MRPIEQIEEAFRKLAANAFRRPGAPPFASIPADEDRDADLIVAASIKELKGLRAKLYGTDSFNAGAEGEVAMLHKKLAEVQEAARDVLEALDWSKTRISYRITEGESLAGDIATLEKIEKAEAKFKEIFT